MPVYRLMTSVQETTHHTPRRGHKCRRLPNDNAFTIRIWRDGLPVKIEKQLRLANEPVRHFQGAVARNVKI